jgi:hypothetical protein
MFPAKEKWCHCSWDIATKQEDCSLGGEREKKLKQVNFL